MKVEFLGGAGTVTGSATLLESGSLKWCRLRSVSGEQGSGGEKIEAFAPTGPEEIALILLTHAHIDHSGLIRTGQRGFQRKGGLYKGYAGPLRDHAPGQRPYQKWKRSGRTERAGGREGWAQPLYTQKDAENSLRCFQSRRLRRKGHLQRGCDPIRDAGQFRLCHRGDLGREGGPRKKWSFPATWRAQQPIVRTVAGG